MNEPVSYFFKVLPGNYFGGRVGIFLEPKKRGAFVSRRCSKRPWGFPWAVGVACDLGVDSPQTRWAST